MVSYEVVREKMNRALSMLSIILLLGPFLQNMISPYYCLTYSSNFFLASMLNVIECSDIESWYTAPTGADGRRIRS